MGQKEKLIARFKIKPKDFTYEELKRMLGYFNYTEEQASGSRVIFVNKQNGHKIKLHKPHPGNVLKRYQIELIQHELNYQGLI